VVVRAQQPAMPVVGYLNGGRESAVRSTTTAFHQGLRELGFVEGRNVEILYRWADTDNDRLPALAADLVRRGVAVIVATNSTGAALAAKSATATISIVFAVGIDPVELGLVASLNRPGGNTTGVSFLVQELVAKRLEVLHQFVPAATSIGFLVNPTLPRIEAQIREAEIAARILGLRLAILKASTASEIEGALANFETQRMDALLAGSDVLLFELSGRLAAWAARNAVPAIYSCREIVDAGGLMSYGASLSDAFRLAGTYAGRILKGEKPADLPVQQATKVELVLNMKTARALGLTFPIALLVRADEVIE
jgi:putative tryptophan/tyrosine transport system substrate-binding protein